jgi:hypothetical protein
VDRVSVDIVPDRERTDEGTTIHTTSCFSIN